MPSYVTVSTEKIQERVEKKLGEDALKSLTVNDDATFTITIQSKSRIRAGNRLETIANMLAIAEMSPDDAENPTAWTIRFGFVQGLK